MLIAGYGGFALGRGFLAGQRRFREYGLSTLAESVLRLVLAIGLLAAGVEALGLAWTLVAGSLVIYLWRPFQGVRARERGAPVEPGTGGAMAAFITANAASQTIVAGGPLVVGALDGSPTEVSVFFETFLLFRAPLTVTYSLVARVLPPFTRWVEQSQRTVIRTWAVRLGIGAGVLAPASFVVGTAIGPALVELMLGAEFRPTRELAGYAAAGVVIATMAPVHATVPDRQTGHPSPRRCVDARSGGVCHRDRPRRGYPIDPSGPSVPDRRGCRIRRITGSRRRALSAR